MLPLGTLLPCLHKGDIVAAHPPLRMCGHPKYGRAGQGTKDGQVAFVLALSQLRDGRPWPGAVAVVRKQLAWSVEDEASGHSPLCPVRCDRGGGPTWGGRELSAGCGMLGSSGPLGAACAARGRGRWLRSGNKLVKALSCSWVAPL